MSDIKIEKAIEIEDGKIYVLETPFHASLEQVAIIQKNWKSATNAKLIVLTGGSKIARTGEDEIREQIAKEIEAMCNCEMYVEDLRPCSYDRAAAIARGNK